MAVIKHDGLIVDILIGNYMGPLANANHPLHLLFTLAWHATPANCTWTGKSLEMMLPNKRGNYNLIITT